MLRARVQPLSLRLWRVPTSAAAVTVRRSGALGARRRSCAAARASARSRAASLRISGGQGSLLVLVVGGAGGAQDVRLTLTA